MPNSQRLIALDALRGFAVLGILWYNLHGHARPFPAMWNPTIAGGMDFWNLNAWVFTSVFVEGAFRGLFCLLFGVGVILATRKAMEPVGPVWVADRFFRRHLVLMAFGLIHGMLLLMPGDILYTYGVAGLFLFPCRLMKARTLVLIALALIGFQTGWDGIQAVLRAAERSSINATAIVHDVSPSALIEASQPVEPDMEDIFSDGYIASILYYAPIYIDMTFTTKFIWALLDAWMIMLLGMALAKSGFFHGLFSREHYLRWGSVALAFALTLRLFATQHQMRFDYEFVHMLPAMASTLGRPLLTLAYACLFMGVLDYWRKGAVGHALSSVGRMALTNYILQTLLTTWIFYGHGLGYFDRFSRIEVLPIIGLLWLVQIVFSLLWLRRFQQGPLEALWRRLVGSAGR